MSRRMTVVFHDEELYTSLKVEAARQHRPASDIITDAVRQWLQKNGSTGPSEKIKATGRIKTKG